MSMTIEELKEKLAEQLDECLLIEVLKKNSFDIVEAFSDYIEENYDYLVTQVE